MGYFVGDSNTLTLIQESGTYASTSGNPVWLGLVQSHELDENINTQSVRYLGNSSRNVGLFVDGQLDFNGTFTYYPQDWRMVGFALGSIVDGGSPSPYSHDLSELESDGKSPFVSGVHKPFLSFTLAAEQFSPGGTGSNFHRYIKGCMIDSLTISADQGGFITNEVSYIAQDLVFASGAGSAVTAFGSRPFMWNDILVHIPSGTAVPEVKSMSLTINNNLVADHYLNGSEVIFHPVPTERDYELSLTLNANDTLTKTFYTNYFLGGSTFNLRMMINDTAAGTGSREATFIMSGCKLVDMESPMNNTGMNEQTLTIKPQNLIVTVSDWTQFYGPF